MNDQKENPYAAPKATGDFRTQVTSDADKKRIVSGKGLELAEELLQFIWSRYRDSLPKGDNKTHLPDYVQLIERVEKGGLLGSKTITVPILSLPAHKDKELHALEHSLAMLEKIKPGAFVERRVHRNEKGTMFYEWRELDLDSEALQPPTIDQKKLHPAIKEMYEQVKPHLDGIKNMIIENYDHYVSQLGEYNSPNDDPFFIKKRIDMVDKHIQALVRAADPQTKFADRVASRDVIKRDTLEDNFTGEGFAEMPRLLCTSCYGRFLPEEKRPEILAHMDAIIDTLNQHQSEIDVATHHALFQQAERGLQMSGHSKGLRSSNS